MSGDDEAERLVRLMVQLHGYQVRQLLEHMQSKRIATVRFSAPANWDTAIDVDLLFSSTGVEQEIVAASVRTELVSGVWMPIAARADLIAMKLLSQDPERRPLDIADLNSLMHGVSSSELERAHRLIELITSRGYSRGRDLKRELEKLISRLTAR